MRTILLLILVIIPYFYTNAQSTKILRFDPENSTGSSVSEVFDEVNIIPLETKKECLFNTIDQLEITNNFFIILDQQTNSILIFEKNGRFSSKITGQSIGYNNGRNIVKFAYNRQTERILVPSPTTQNETLEFDCNGKMMQRIKGISSSFADLFIFSDGTEARTEYQADSRLPDSIAYELYTSKNASLRRKYLPYNKKYSPLKSKDILHSSHSKFYYQEQDTSVLFTRPYDYNIYRLTTNKLDTCFKIILPMYYSLPTKFRTDTLISNKRIQLLKEQPNLIYSVSNTYQLGNNLFIKLNSTNNNQHFSMIYNIISDKIIDVSKIKADQKSYFFAITDAAVGGIDFKNKNFVNINGNYLYTFYSSLRFFMQKEANERAGRSAIYPPHLVEYFRMGNRGSNHLIIQLKPKTN